MEDQNNYRSDNEDFQNSIKNELDFQSPSIIIKKVNTEEYEKKMEELLEKNDILETRLKVIGEQKYKLISKLKNSEDENEILKEQITEQNNNNRQLNLDKEKYEKEIYELKIFNKELNEKTRNELEKKNNELEEKEKKIDNLNKKLKAKEETIKYFTINNEESQRNKNLIKEELENEKKINMKHLEKINELEKKIDQLFLQKQSEGTLLLEIEHLKDDNIRLLQMLKTTEEFKNFSYLNDTFSGIKLNKKKNLSNINININNNNINTNNQDLNLKDNENKENKESKENVIPNDAFDFAFQFKNKYDLNDSIINELLTSLNKIWKEKEKKEMNKIKKKYQTEINNLKRKLTMKSGYDEFTAQKTISKLKKDLKKTKNDLKENIVLNNKLKNAPIEMDLVDNAIKVTSNYQNSKKFFENEINILKKKLAEKNEKNSGSHLQYNQGIFWMIGRCFEEIVSLEKNILELFSDYDKRINSFNFNIKDDLIDYNLKFVLNSVKWVFNSLKQMIFDVRDKFSNWKNDSMRNLNMKYINFFLKYNIKQF